MNAAFNQTLKNTATNAATNKVNSEISANPTLSTGLNIVNSGGITGSAPSNATIDPRERNKALIKKQAAENKEKNAATNNIAISALIEPALIEAELYLSAAKQVKARTMPLILDATNELLDFKNKVKYNYENSDFRTEEYVRNDLYKRYLDTSDEEPKKTKEQFLEELKKRWFFGGGKQSSLSQIQKGGRQSAKRTQKSINEFLNSSVTSSQILSMFNNQEDYKRNTKVKRKRNNSKYSRRIRANKMH